MRQLLVHVPEGKGEEVLQRAGPYEPLNTLVYEAHDEAGPRDVVVLHISNARVDALLEELEELPDLRVTFFPKDVIALRPPADEAPDRVTDVEMRSPIEIYLAGHQSIGSWIGHFGYSVAAGVVVWIGLFTNTVFLLTAAMLIAPFGGPAMNVAIGSASGDGYLLKRSLLRYLGALGVTISMSTLLTLVFGPDLPTSLMLAQSRVPQVAVLLPLIAGAAGALTLVQSENDSLVSGAAIGILVAASLAPPAGLVGMSIPMLRWDLMAGGVFLLVLQLVGINASASIIFRLRGVRGGGSRYQTDTPNLFAFSTGFTVLAIGALLFLQLSGGPVLERGTLEQHITAEVKQLIMTDTLAAPVEVESRFTRANIAGQRPLLVEAYVQPTARWTSADTLLKRRLVRDIQQHIRRQWPELTPLVQISVVEPPDRRR